MSDWSNGTCPRHKDCAFYQSVVSSPLLRVKYATMYPYCKDGKHESCMRWWLMEQGSSVAEDLLPDGGKDNFAAETRGARFGGGRKVMVVDDLPLFRKSLVTLVMNACGGSCDVVEADSGEMALSKLMGDPSGWMMLVTDHNMGAMSGYDLIVQMRSHMSMSGVPAIVFSSETADAIQQRCIALPRVRWLEKKPNQALFDTAWRDLVLEHKT